MTNNTIRQFNRNKQSGVTLLLSILVMSGILVIVMAVTLFAIQELRASRSSALSEPAIIAAETSGEQGVWLIKRGTTPAQCSASTTTTQIDGTTSAASSGAARVVTTKCIAYDKAIFELEPNEVATFFLYDPTDINGNFCMNTAHTSGTYVGCTATGAPPTGDQIFKTLRFTLKSGTLSPTVAVQTLDNVTVVGSPITISTDGSANNFNIPDPIAGSTDERLRVTITAPSDYVTLEVTTLNGVQVGLPDYPTVNAAGCSAVVAITNCNANTEIFQRRLNITVPK